jgi:UDP-N-acetylglucosamine--N-acetylmuramyl-(pentapeptide) pyrophosphoryl-undecaprenol N-acetylglucosamine transferase
MELALGAATLAVSRAGASSLAELAAMRVPAVLVPYPAATDNHQFYNARAFEETGAARLLEQNGATPETFGRLILELVGNTAARERMQAALAKWHTPRAAEQIAELILSAILRSADSHVRVNERACESRKQNGPRSGPVERQNFSAA